MNWNNKEKQNLIKAILALKTRDEAERFLRDLLTEGEIEEFSKRLQTAELLNQQVPYSQIEAITGFSSTTVARVSKWLNGKNQGYKTVINKLHHHSAQTGKELS
ncbi:MAG: YerC/YecD family TrpR-related protein [bacterium]